MGRADSTLWRIVPDRDDASFSAQSVTLERTPIPGPPAMVSPDRSPVSHVEQPRTDAGVDRRSGHGLPKTPAIPRCGAPLQIAVHTSRRA